MIHEYAVDPDVLLAWAATDRDYAEFFREYGLGTPRIFSSFPKGKAHKLRSFLLQNSPSNNNSLQAQRYTVMVEKLHEDIIHRDVPSYPVNDWSELAKLEHERLPFCVIVSSRPIEIDKNITLETMYAQGSIWNHPSQLNIVRTHQGFCVAVSNLLRVSTKQVVVIDAYGGTREAITQMQHLIRCIIENRVNNRVPNLTLFYKTQHKSPDASYVKSSIVAGFELNASPINVDVFELEEIPGNDVFHNRCILTEHGGITTGHGIGVSGDASHTDEAILLNSELYKKKWQQFMDDRCFCVISRA